MVERTTRWPALVLLAFSAALAAPDPIVIERINWSYEGTTTSLEVCISVGLTLLNKVTLTVTSSVESSIDVTYQGNIDNTDKTCADFEISTSARQPLPAVDTNYEITVSTYGSPGTDLYSGSVNFALVGATVQCGTPPSTFVRVEGGTVAGVESDVICLTAPAVCYLDATASADFCISGLGDSLSVCVQAAAFDDITLNTEGGTLTADALDYESSTFTMTVETITAPMAELLICAVDGTWDVGVCAAGSDSVLCTAPNLILPSATDYQMTGVFSGGTDATALAASNTFYDMQLAAVQTTSTIDFHFINKKLDEQYFVYGIDSSSTTIHQVSLNCEHIEQNSACNGFFDRDDSILSVAVAYEDGNINKIITSVTTQSLSVTAVNAAAKDKEDVSSENVAGKIANDSRIYETRPFKDTNKSVVARPPKFRRSSHDHYKPSPEEEHAHGPR